MHGIAELAESISLLILAVDYFKRKRYYRESGEEKRS